MLLLVAGFEALRRHAVTAAWVSTGVTAFTTTHGVVDWVHDHTTYTRTATQPTAATGLTGHLLVVLTVAHATNGGQASRKDHPHLSAGQCDHSVLAVTGLQLG